MTVKAVANQFGDGFLSASDLLVKGKWKEFTLAIKAVHAAGTVKADNQQLIDRPVIQFDKAKKLFAPSKVTLKLIRFQTGVDLTGPDKDLAVGQTITLYPVIGDWFSIENLAGIRVRIDRDKPKPMIKKKDMGRDITGTGKALESIDIKPVNSDEGILTRLTKSLETDDAAKVDQISQEFQEEAETPEDAELVRELCGARLDQIQKSETPF